MTSIRLLENFPQIGTPRGAHSRMLITRKYHYRVYYAADDKAAEIVVLAIRHPARAGR